MQANKLVDEPLANMKITLMMMHIVVLAKDRELEEEIQFQQCP